MFVICERRMERKRLRVFVFTFYERTANYEEALTQAAISSGDLRPCANATLDQALERTSRYASRSSRPSSIINLNHSSRRLMLIRIASDAIGNAYGVFEFPGHIGSVY